MTKYSNCVGANASPCLSQTYVRGRYLTGALEKLASCRPDTPLASATFRIK